MLLVAAEGPLHQGCVPRDIVVRVSVVWVAVQHPAQLVGDEAKCFALERLHPFPRGADLENLVQLVRNGSLNFPVAVFSSSGVQR